MQRTYILAPTDLGDETRLADWLEASMLVERTEYASRAKIRRYIKSLFGEDELDIAVETVLREINRRKRLCQQAYPFSEESSGVRYSVGKAGVPYLFMLCISASETYRAEKRQKETDELFDELVLDALKACLGPTSEGERFGSPASGSRPKNFRDSIRWIAHRMNLQQGKGNPRTHTGDGGLDVIAWRPFRDRRSGYMVLLAQCTVERDWFHKARDLQQDAWRGWIDLGKDPHLVFAIPFVIAAQYDKWDELRRLVHTALDRLRLCELLDSVPLRASQAIQKWVASEVDRMSGAK